MSHHPRVKLSRINGDDLYSVVLDMNTTYKTILRVRLKKLQNFTSNNSLEEATALINEAGVACTEKDVDKALFGSKGLIPSTLASLNGNNTNRPKSHTGRLTRRDGSPMFEDQHGNEYVRGVIIEGHYPLKEAKHLFTAIRNCLEENLNLPRYIRHQIVSGDETSDRL